jgi:hypothetical protein
MPTAFKTKNAMSGIKRKSAPEKDANVKGIKKPKINAASKSALKSKSTRAPAKVFKESSESSDDWDGEDEGADKVGEDEDMGMGEDGDYEPTPKVADGLHPDRAKAVVTNSRSTPYATAHLILTTTRSVIERSPCETKTVGTRAQSCKAIGRFISPYEEALGTSPPKVACTIRGEAAVGCRAL